MSLFQIRGANPFCIPFGQMGDKLGQTGIVSGPLRFRDEFVRHKILDLLGDLALLGSPLQGHIHARKAGHALHIEFARALARQGDLAVPLKPLARQGDLAVPLKPLARQGDLAVPLKPPAASLDSKSGQAPSSREEPRQRTVNI